MPKLPLWSGQTYTTTGPITFGPGKYGALSNASASGPITVHGYSPSDSNNFFRLNDGSSDLTFDGLEFTALWRNWITAAERATWRNCHFHHNRMEGIILGACVDCVIEDCVAEYCGPQYLGGYSDDSHHEPSADHAYYFSYGGSGNSLRRSIGRHVSGCGLHFYGNADEGDYQIHFTGEDIALSYCGSEGTPTIQPTGTKASTIKNLLVAFSQIGDWTWDDADDMPCEGWVIDGFTQWSPDARFCIHVTDGVRDITYRNGIILVPPGCTLCESTDGGDFEYPTFEDCLIGIDDPRSLPDVVRQDNTIWDLNRLNALFPRALQNDFVPTDSGVSGFRDWRLPTARKAA